MSKRVAYDDELSEDVVDVLVQAKDLSEHVRLVGHVRGNKEYEILDHGDAQQAHVGRAEYVEIHGVAAGLERVHEADELHAHAEHRLLVAFRKQAKTTGQDDVDNVGEHGAVLRAEGREIHAVVFDVGHGVVYEATHEVVAGVWMPGHELAYEPPDVGQVERGEDVPGIRDEHLGRPELEDGRPDGVHVHVKHVAVDLLLHPLSVVGQLVE